jgi:hypothetical protein
VVAKMPPRRRPRRPPRPTRQKHPRGGITHSVATARGGAKRDVGDRGRPSNDDANNYGDTIIRVGRTKAMTEQLTHSTNTYNYRHNYSRYKGRGATVDGSARRVHQRSLQEGDDARGRQLH